MHTVHEQNHNHGLLDEGTELLFGCISKEMWTLSYDSRFSVFTGTVAATPMCHQFFRAKFCSEFLMDPNMHHRMVITFRLVMAWSHC